VRGATTYWNCCPEYCPKAGFVTALRSI